MSESASALVTGATGALGGVVVDAFLRRGCRVVGTYRSAEGAARLRAEQAAAGERLELVAVDLDDAAAVGEAVARHGRFDRVVHLAGAWEGGVPLWETTDALFERMLATNLRSAFHVCRAVVPALLAGGGGRIALCASSAARRIRPGQAAYTIAKAGVVALTEALSAEFAGRDVAVNCVLPETIDTPANRRAMAGADPSRWVAPAQIADVLWYLVSPEAAGVRGAAIVIEGRG